MDKQYILYKIYSENCLLYIGRTKQKLQTRLHGHFFKKPIHREINIEIVSKIEYALFPTEADMNVYEVYLINKHKPPLNRDDKAKDSLTFSLPDVEFHEFSCKLMEKWKKEIRQRDSNYIEMKRRKNQIEEEKAAKRKEIYGREDLTTEEKFDLFTDWLINYYEPARNGLIEVSRPSIKW